MIITLKNYVATVTLDSTNTNTYDLRAVSKNDCIEDLKNAFKGFNISDISVMPLPGQEFST